MIIQDAKHLLFIEPKSSKIEPAVLDAITDFLQLAMQKATPNTDYTKGWHSCACGQAHSDSVTWSVNLGGKTYKTNTLALHYVKNHRSEVPASELEKITLAMNLSMQQAKKIKP